MGLKSVEICQPIIVVTRSRDSAMLRGHIIFCLHSFLSIALKQVIFSHSNAISNERELMRWSMNIIFAALQALYS